MTETMTETSTDLTEALGQNLRRLFGTDVHVGPYHTGGGCMVLEIDLSQDGRGIGRRIWLTREENWYLGFYGPTDNPLESDRDEDYGVVVALLLSEQDMDNPDAVAREVVGILSRLGVRTLA